MNYLIPIIYVFMMLVRVGNCNITDHNIQFMKLQMALLFNLFNKINFAQAIGDYILKTFIKHS